MNTTISPKEQAEMLVISYLKYIVEYDEHQVLLEDEKIKFAKKCATKVVDEAIGMIEEICENSGYDPFESPLYHLKYCQEVKAELLKEE